MTNDFMLLFPVILVSLGGIALMLAATCHCYRDEQAAWVCGGLFGLAFLVQLGATLTGDHSLYGSLFKDILVVSPFSQAAGLVILGCGLFTVLSSLSYFKRNSLSGTEYYSLLLFAAAGITRLQWNDTLCLTALDVGQGECIVLTSGDRKSVV